MNRNYQDLKKMENINYCGSALSGSASIANIAGGTKLIAFVLDIRKKIFYEHTTPKNNILIQ